MFATRTASAAARQRRCTLCKKRDYCTECSECDFCACYDCEDGNFASSDPELCSACFAQNNDGRSFLCSGCGENVGNISWCDECNQVICQFCDGPPAGCSPCRLTICDDCIQHHKCPYREERKSKKPKMSPADKCAICAAAAEEKHSDSHNAVSYYEGGDDESAPELEWCQECGFTYCDEHELEATCDGCGACRRCMKNSCASCGREGCKKCAFVGACKGCNVTMCYYCAHEPNGETCRYWQDT